MTGVIATIPKYQFSGSNGAPLANGTLTVYVAGSTTPTNTWQDKSQTTLNTNPITLDSRGECVLWLDPAISYKFVLKNAAGAIQWTQDNITGSGGANSSAIVYTPAGTGAVATTVQTKLRESVSVKDFGAVGDGVTDDTAAIQEAIDHVATAGGGIVVLPAGVYLVTDTLTDYNTVAVTSNGKTVILKGVGSSEVSSDTPLTRIKTSGAIVGIHFNGNRSGGENFIIEGDDGAFDGTSHGILVDASRSSWKNIVSTKHRGDGVKFRFGNVSHFESILCLANKGNGFNVDGTGYVTPAGVSRPNDANASTFITIDARSNGLVGIRTGVNSTFSNFFYNITAQANTGYGVEFNGDYNRAFGMYTESNNAAGVPAYDIHFSSTADNNHLFGVFSNYAYPATGTNGVFLDDSTNQRNYVHPFTSSVANAYCSTLTLGSTTSGIAGYIVFNGDDGIQPKISLEGTSATQTLKITSSGAGDLGIDPDFITAEAWTAPTLLNSWVDFGGSRVTAGYWKDKYGMVHLRGVIKSGTTTNPTILFNLPAGYRPTGRNYFPVSSNGAFGSCFIDSDGNVYFEAGSNVSYSLSGISFRTA